jgi:hypothetical protein
MGLIVLTGTGIRDTRELTPSATMALRLLCNHMKLRRLDSKDWEGKPDKFQFFSPNPGAG